MFFVFIIHIIINNKQSKEISANEVLTHIIDKITVCEDNYKEEEKNHRQDNNEQKEKSFKEIAIQVHELMP
jgi:hypothetical protein